MQISLDDDKKRIEKYNAREALFGLTEEEVRQNRSNYGENRLSKQKRKGFFMSFLESFGDPMIKVLLIALAINIIFLFKNANWFESVGIAAAILLATLVSTISEYGSESAFERLQEEVSKVNCRVRRAKGLVEIPMTEIVVGDIVLLQAGDRIPADGIILDGALEVDQSSLNGESKEARKFPRELMKDPSKAVGDFINPALLFSGTIVCAGEGLMRVTEVGDNTFYGQIGAELQEETRESPLKLRLGELAGAIGKFGYVAAVFSALAYLFNVIVLDNMFNTTLMLYTLTSPSIMFAHILKAATLAVTVIVMAVPEGLPMMITVVLSANMKRMLRDNVLVRKLVGIETAGSLNILFTDKTGTLTQGKLDVTQYISGSGRSWTKKEIQAKQMKLREILYDSIYYNNAASMDNGVAIGGNATDRATLEFVSKFRTDRKKLEKTNVIPFSSDTKFMATTVSGDREMTFIKGAPEKILPFCTEYYDEAGAAYPFKNRRKIDEILVRLAEQAVRIIAIAVSDSAPPKNGTFGSLKFVGLLGIRDEIRPDAIEGVRQVQSAGIQTVMITGDSYITALAIARDVGLINEKSDLIITSDELNDLSDEELTAILPNLRVVARALPSDKSRLVRIAQAQNLVVGMTGDGVNDAPALKQADIGFSMGSGTEVAKEAGDIVILDDDFMSISKAVCYGRTVFKSIRKFIIYQMSICMCAVGVTVIGPLIGVDFPITVIQMLWINMVMDTLAGLAFSGEIARRKYMQEPPKQRNEPIVNKYMKWQIAVNSVYTTLLCLFFLKSPTLQNMFSARDNVYKMTAFFALFMFMAIFTSFCARTHQINLFDYLAANKPFLWIMGLVTTIQVLLIYYGGTVFRTVRLDVNDIILVVILAFTIIPVDMLRKYLLGKNPEFSGT